MYYYVFSESNITNARVQATHFLSISNLSTNSIHATYGQDMYDEVYSIPFSESGPFTQAQKDQLRQPADSFPFIQKCKNMARIFE